MRNLLEILLTARPEAATRASTAECGSTSAWGSTRGSSAGTAHHEDTEQHCVLGQHLSSSVTATTSWSLPWYPQTHVSLSVRWEVLALYLLTQISPMDKPNHLQSWLLLHHPVSLDSMKQNQNLLELKTLTLKISVKLILLKQKFWTFKTGWESFRLNALNFLLCFKHFQNQRKIRLTVFQVYLEVFFLAVNTLQVQLSSLHKEKN